MPIWTQQLSHLVTRGWFLMVTATGTNTLGFIVWTFALAVVTWLATVVQQTVELKSRGNEHPFATALGRSASSGLYTFGSVALLAIFVWTIFIVVVVYKDHNSLTASITSLRGELEKRQTPSLSIHIKGWIDNQDQNHNAIVQVWLGVDNSGEADTLRDWKIAVRVGNTVREGSHSIGQPALKGGLNIPFLDAEFQRPVGVVADMQGYVTFGIRGINQQQFDSLYLDRSTTLIVSAIDSKGRKIEAERNIYQTWLEGHETRPAR